MKQLSPSVLRYFCTMDVGNGVKTLSQYLYWNLQKSDISKCVTVTLHEKICN